MGTIAINCKYYGDWILILDLEMKIKNAGDWKCESGLDREQNENGPLGNGKWERRNFGADAMGKPATNSKKGKKNSSIGNKVTSLFIWGTTI